MDTHRKIGLVVAGLAAAVVTLAPVGAYAVDTAATATVTGGTLSFSTPATATFSATLNGTDQSVTAPQAFDVFDDTGSGSGWNITATSTTFASGSHLLATTATTVTSAPTVAPDNGVGTDVDAITDVSYPYTLPAATVAPTATKLFNATALTGIGHQTATATMALAIPRTTYAGAYTSTWTYSLVSAP